jgi:hypothetical protein
MQSAIKSAMSSSSATHRKATKEHVQTKNHPTGQTKSRPLKDDPHIPPKDDHPPPKEFVVHSSSAPKRLNDIVLAPPVFGARVGKLGGMRNGKVGEGSGKGRGERSKGIGKVDNASVLSMAQKQMMEEEREKIIKRYRELKQQRTSVA